jgi:hypothetical protein
MGVQRQEFPELSINNPPNRPIGILALDPKDGFVAVERMQTVANPDPESMQKNWHTTVAFLVPFEPKFEHECGETTSDEFVGDVYAVLS